MPQESHIAGIVIYAHTNELRAIRAWIALLPGGQVHAVSDDGKLVATLETDSMKRTLDCMDAIRALRGVLNVALVYQHAEPSSALDEEVDT